MVAAALLPVSISLLSSFRWFLEFADDKVVEVPGFIPGKKEGGPHPTRHGTGEIAEVVELAPTESAASKSRRTGRFRFRAPRSSHRTVVEGPTRAEFVDGEDSADGAGPPVSDEGTRYGVA